MIPRSTELHLSTGCIGKVLDLRSSDKCYEHVFIGAHFCLDLLVTYGNNTKLCVVDHVYWLARDKLQWTNSSWGGSRYLGYWTSLELGAVGDDLVLVCNSVRHPLCSLSHEKDVFVLTSDRR